MILRSSEEGSERRPRVTGFRRMILLYGLKLTLTALIVMVFLMLNYDRRTFKSSMVRRAGVEANLIAEVSTAALRFGDTQGLQEILTGMCEHMAVDSVAVYDVSDTVVASCQKPGGHTLPESRPDESMTDSPDYITVVCPVLLHGEMIGAVAIRRGLGELRERGIRSLSVAALMLVGSLAVAFVVSDRIRATVTGPVDSLIRAASQISLTRDYSVRAPVRGVGELRELTQAFNTMVAEAEEHSEKMAQATRELQTEVAQRSEAEKELSAYQAELEQRVAERTGELRNRVEEAELLNKAMVNLLEDLQDANARLEDATRRLQTTNEELEAFSYSVSHDLRAPLRGIDGFSRAILEDYNDVLDESGKDYLARVRGATQRMGGLIDDLLKLSRISRQDLLVEQVDLSHLADGVIKQLRSSEPGREVSFSCEEGITANGDANLLHILLVNLLGNAWKFTGKRTDAKIDMGWDRSDGEETVYYIKDNGAGFDMKYTERLFGAFQRLHKSSDFGGTGIGLTTVRRIIHRHGGRVWAEGRENEGATFFFTMK